MRFGQHSVGGTGHHLCGDVGPRFAPMGDLRTSAQCRRGLLVRDLLGQQVASNPRFGRTLDPASLQPRCLLQFLRCRQLPPQIRKLFDTDRRTGRSLVRYEVTVDTGLSPATGKRRQARRRYPTEKEGPGGPR